MVSAAEGLADLGGRLATVRRRIAAACQRGARDPSTVRLVAVTKGQPAEIVRMAQRLGLDCFGENRVQEAQTKIAQIEPRPSWHLVGHLQSNKVKLAARLFEVVHSVDRVELVVRLERACAESDRSLGVFVQLDLAGEATKFGAAPAELPAILEALETAPHLEPHGLMTLPPLLEDLERVRPYFRKLRELLERERGRFPRLGAELSMGMSHDFEIAIEEGATYVRIGTALFGARAS